MKLIDRYITIEFLRIFFLSFITLVVFYEMVVFLDMVGYFNKFGASANEVARYMLFKVPMAFFHVTPISVLLAALLTSGSLSRYSEIVAMKMSGMSTLRIAAPVIICSAVLSLLSFLNSEYLFHLAATETNRIYIEEIKNLPRKSLFSKDRIWYKSDDGAIWNISHIDIDKDELLDLSIFRFDETGTKIKSRVQAAKGKMAGDEWIFNDYTERLFQPGGTFTEKHWDIKKLPAFSVASEGFDKVALDPEEMNLAQISEYIDDIKTKGYDATRYIAEKHSKVAFPLISLVMPLIAFPMGIRSSRSGGALVGIAVALAIGALFWFLFSMGVAFGRAGRLPPEFSVYGAHIVFASIGLLMLLSRKK